MVEQVEQECVHDGVLDYSSVLSVVMENLHIYNAMDKHKARSIGNSVILKLEHKYPKNVHGRSAMYRAVCDLYTEGMFHNSSFSHKKYFPNKKDAVQKEDVQEEAEEEHEGDDCSDQEGDS